MILGISFVSSPFFHPYLKSFHFNVHLKLIDKMSNVNRLKYQSKMRGLNNICVTGVPNSKTFDVTLMVALLRNLSKLPPPICGYDHLPLSTDTTPMADLARIKHYRNRLSHFGDGKIKSTVFVTAWEDISKVRISFQLDYT